MVRNGDGSGGEVGQVRQWRGRGRVGEVGGVEVEVVGVVVAGGVCR